MKRSVAILLLTVSILSTPISAFAQSVPNIPGLGALPGIKAGIEAQQLFSNRIPTVPTSDIKLNAKETGISVFGFDIGVSWNQVALNIAKIVVSQVVDSTVTWFQSGFEGGGPAYVTDPKSYFGTIANGVVGDELNRLSNGVLCSPFQAKITLALRQATLAGGGATYSPQCTLSGIVDNYDNFMNDFKQGGLDAFFAISQNSENNPYGAYANAQLTINNKVQAEVDSASQLVTWGSGFKSQQTCKARNISREAAQNWINSHPNDNSLPPGYNPKADFGACIEYTGVSTPGATLKSHLDEVLPANNFVKEIISADQFDKLLTSLGNGLLQRFVFKKNGSSSGILGNADSSSGTSGSSGPVTLAPTITCNPNVDLATANEEPVSWTVSDNFDGTTLNTYTWSGTDGLTGSQSIASITYKIPGTKEAKVSVSITKMNDLGETVGEAKTYAVACQKTVTVSAYRPLSVSCGAYEGATSIWNDEAVKAPTVAGPKWRAVITGGSGDFTGIEWNGDQDFPPGTNSDGNRIWPNRYNAPNAVDSIKVSGSITDILHVFALKSSGFGASSEKITKSKDAKGNPVTEVILQRPYYKDGKNTQVMAANITVTDKDLKLPTVTAQCTPSVTMIDQ